MPRGNANDIRSAPSRQPVLWFVVAWMALCAVTLDGVFAAHPLWMRAAALAPGMALGAWCLARTLSSGRVSEDARLRWLYMLAGIHVAATLFFFPTGQLFDPRPIVTTDHAVHYAQALRARQVFWHSLRLDCYSPYFMAGYPAGSVFDLDMKGAELFAALIPLHTATALKIFILVAYLSMLPSVYRGARMLGFDLDEALLGVMLLLAYWHWGRPYASDFRFVGMFSFVFATHAAIYVTGLVRRFVDGERGRSLFVLGPVAFLVHVLSAVMAAIPIGTVLFADRRRLTRRRCELLFLWALVVIFVNGLWILPLIRFLPDKTPTEAYYQLHGLRHMAHLLFHPTGAVALGVLVLAVVGAGRLQSERRDSVGAPLLVACVVMLAFAAFGVNLPGVNQLEPGRFLFSAIVFATPLAGTGLAWLTRRAAEYLNSRGAARLRTAVYVSLALAPLPLAMLDAKAYYHHSLTVHLPARVEALRSVVLANVRGEGRLMIEEGGPRAYDGFFLPALLPWQTHIEQIGGPYPNVPLIHHRITFDQTSLLGHPLDAWTPARLSYRLGFLRVRWVVSATPAGGRLAAKIPGASLKWADGPLRFWELPLPDLRPPVRAEIDHVSARIPVGSPPVVLPYHWMDGLKTSNGNEIVPVLRDDDPVPYVCVRETRSTPVEIRYAPSRWLTQSGSMK
ncbi:MAG TPA: hypothetical protein VFH88_08260 [Candidatus Krumholzibacteria bacterium]|nr:hypothetical protein [Candidatus Krumholzibacteria bacterium]